VFVNVLHHTTARATGRSTAALDRSSNAKLSTPKELGGVGGIGANPEQLLATGSAAFRSCWKFRCLASTARH
jgi:lipoyl-dependent peroxiredoxin